MAQVKDLVCYGPAKFLGKVELNEWVGTLAEYDAITQKNPDMTYYIIEN